MCYNQQQPPRQIFAFCDVCGRPVMNAHVIDERFHVVKDEDREASKLKCIDLCDECFAAIEPKVVADK